MTRRRSRQLALGAVAAEPGRPGEAPGFRLPALGKLLLQAVAVSLLAVLLALLAWRVATMQRGQNLGSAVAAGKRPAAPDFELQRLDGKGRFRLSSLRGKAVVLNFWASWCTPCRDEARLLEAAWRRYRSRDLVVVGVDAQDFSSDARRFVRRYRQSYPQLHDGPGATLEHYGVSGFPESWFIDRSGRLVAEHVQGPLGAERLERDIEVALG